ncbi:putative AC transposase [Morella rubra]|uniref:Putative AC transposase n=1 Tax=Morella rubra TaxID=262757 RepID=A0A6A1UXP7_9ROSI|nr:putative AC transposase [Morella rubra]
MDEISSTPTTNIGSCPSSGGPSNRLDESVSSSRSPEHEDPTNQPEEEQPSKKRKNVCKSFVWDHFTKILPVVKPEHPEAKCHYCKAKVGCHPEHHGTSGMRSHLKRCLPYLKQLNQLVRRWIVEFLIMDEMPFRTVQRIGFRKLVTRLEPRFKMPTRYTIMKDCMELYIEERTKLKEAIVKESPRVCFTTNTWTSVQNVNYMCVIAHFIDRRWCLQKLILYFRRITNHNGATIGKEIEECMNFWGIAKILTITVDNATNNDTTIEQVKKKQLGGGANVVCKHNFIHMRCAAHILNLIIHEGLKELDDSVAKIRNIIKYVKSSPQRLAGFKKAASDRFISERNFLQMDVPTRWNSTYVMLERAEKFRGVFENMLEEDENLVMFLNEDDHGRKGLGTPSFEDWEHIRQLVKFLKVFYEITLHISGSKYVTSNAFFEELARIKFHLETFTTCSDILLCDMAKRMQSKYDKYWGDLRKVNRLLFVAAVLDPRFKLISLEYWAIKNFGKDRGMDFTTMVRDTLETMFEEYSGCVITQPAQTSGSQSSVSMDEMNIENQLWGGLSAYRQQQNLLNNKSEVERYLIEDVEPKVPGFDILLWWKVNSQKFQILSRIAKDVLAIPISTVPCESAFSTEGQVLDPFRSSLAPCTVEGLICAQNWLHVDPILEEDDAEVDGGDDPLSYKLDIEIENLRIPVE